MCGKWSVSRMCNVYTSSAGRRLQTLPMSMRGGTYTRVCSDTQLYNNRGCGGDCKILAVQASNTVNSELCTCVRVSWSA